MKRTLYSPVLATVIFSLGLVVSAVIVSRRDISTSIISEQVIKTQFVIQIKEQTGNSPYNIMGHKRVLDDVVIDKFQMSPKRNHVDIDYHLTWQDSKTIVATQMSLTKDEFGRFDSGEVIGSLANNKRYRIIVQ